MKIPKKVKILGHTFEVKLVEKPAGDNGLDGHYNWNKQIIELRQDLMPEKKESVFFHEMAEALSAQLHLPYHETQTHDGFARFYDIFFGVLKENKLI